MPRRRRLRPLACALLVAGAAETMRALESASQESWPPELTASAGELTSRDEVFTSALGSDVALRFWLRNDAASDAERLVPTTRAALARFSEWFGDFPHESLSVIDLPWHGGAAGASYLGAVTTRTRWLAPPRDLTAERSLIAGISRQYWMSGDGDAPAFQEGLSRYAGTRGIHDLLEGRNFATERYFGGFFPLVIRSVAWSPSHRQLRPRIRHFLEVDGPETAASRASAGDADQAAQRAALALHTLERFVGWPAFQQALGELYKRRAETGVTPQALAEILSRQRGVDLSWCFAVAFRPDTRFDYGIDALSSVPSASDPARFRTVVALRRLADGIFASPGGGAESRVLPVHVRFADGAEIVDYWDDRETKGELVYESRARAVSATIDPDLMLLLDADRRNNSRSLGTSTNATGVRLALHWLVWLQDLMLSSSALA